MRLFNGLYLALAGQALVVATVPPAVLIWNLSEGQRSHARAQDSASLASLAAIASTQAAAGVQPSGLIEATRDAISRHNGPNTNIPLPEQLNRIAILGPGGGRVAGVDGVPIEARPVIVNGRTIAAVALTAPPTLTGDAYNFMERQIIGIVLIMGMLALGLFIIGYVIADRFSKPQLALFRFSRTIAEGDYEADVEETGPDETRATIRNLGRIARQFDRLESARRTWLVSVSEELRKPVLALGDRLDATIEATEEEKRAPLEEVMEDVRRLAEMADDLHAVALADLGRLPVTFATVDPLALIHNTIWAMGKRAKAQGVRLEPGALPQTTVPVKWDGSRIEQLFSALIENSLRYTPAGGLITLGLEGQRNAWRLIIDDSAPGVDVGLAQRLFEPFYRTSIEPGESVTTSGLGLATAQAIVEAHHGRIEASRSPLGGLRITVVLPGGPPTA